MKDLLAGPSLEASLDELKDIYRVLMGHLDEHPELEDNGFLAALENLLETQARTEGIDVDDEAQWEAWLRGEPRDATSRGDLVN